MQVQMPKKSAPQWLYSVNILGVRRSLLRNSASEAAVSTLSSIQMSQVLEACRHVDCVGDKRLTTIFEAIRRRLEAVPELVEAARSGYVPAAVPDQIDPGDPKGVRPAHGAVAEAAVKAFDNDRRSLISTWVIASTAASTPGAGESASVLAQLLIPVVSDLGLLSFARRADMMLMLEALQRSGSWAHVQHNPSATIAARLIQRALQFDQFGDAEPGGGDTETGATGAPPSAGLVRFSFRVSLLCVLCVSCVCVLCVSCVSCVLCWGAVFFLVSVPLIFAAALSAIFVRLCCAVCGCGVGLMRLRTCTWCVCVRVCVHTHIWTRATVRGREGGRKREY
jgi:hypothetical protein